MGDWLYPEFAQQEEPFLALLDALPESSHFGVQYDPSNAVVGGFDPIAFLERIKHRVVTMHASDRFLVPGTTLAEIQLQDGTVGYPDKLKHGETGQGTNDYDAIFRILRSANFSGWISVEDGMDGLDELAPLRGVPEEPSGAGALWRLVIVLHRRCSAECRDARVQVQEISDVPGARCCGTHALALAHRTDLLSPGHLAPA